MKAANSTHRLLLLCRHMRSRGVSSTLCVPSTCSRPPGSRPCRVSSSRAMPSTVRAQDRACPHGRDEPAAAAKDYAQAHAAQHQCAHSLMGSGWVVKLLCSVGWSSRGLCIFFMGKAAHQAVLQSRVCAQVWLLLSCCCCASRVAPARIACLDMNLQKARMQMGVQVRTCSGRLLHTAVAAACTTGVMQQFHKGAYLACACACPNGGPAAQVQAVHAFAA
jgi:hypothetical protein